jgi:hypothetical protein
MSETFKDTLPLLKDYDSCLIGRISAAHARHRASFSYIPPCRDGPSLKILLGISAQRPLVVRLITPNNPDRLPHLATPLQHPFHSMLKTLVETSSSRPQVLAAPLKILPSSADKDKRNSWSELFL